MLSAAIFQLLNHEPRFTLGMSITKHLVLYSLSTALLLPISSLFLSQLIKINCTPHKRYKPHLFLVCRYYPNLKSELGWINPMKGVINTLSNKVRDRSEPT